jgi:protein-tyrosine phosphatase
MDFITDQIAIGNYLDAARDTLAREVDAILCLRGDCACEARDDIDVLYLPLNDGPGNRREKVDQALRFVDEVVRAGRRILVHCHAGRSRSVVIVARYLMRSRAMTSTAALELIGSKREIYLSPGIEELL